MYKPNLVLSGIEDIYSSNIDKLIEVADEFNISHLDLWFPKNFDFASLPKVAEKIKKSKKKVVCVTTWSHLYSEKVENEIELVLQSLNVAQELGAERINTYFGHYTCKNDQRAIEVYTRNIERVLKIAEDFKIKVCLENEFNSRGNDPHSSDITRSADLVLKLMQKVNSPYFRLTYDPSNFYIAGEEAFPYAYRLLQEYIDYIHLKDARKYYPKTDSKLKIWSDQDRNYVFTPIGSGAVNFLEIFKELVKDNYSGYLTLEPHTGESLLEDYRVSIEFINRSFRWLMQDSL